jgi:hypothetical protein
MKIEEIAEIVEAVEDGHRSALEAYAYFDTVIKQISSAQKQIKQLAFDEAEQEPEKSFIAHGYEIQKRGGGMSYSFKNIPKHEEMKRQITEYEALLKNAFKIFQSSGKTVIDEETGEIVPLCEATPKADSLIIKLANNEDRGDCAFM